MTRIDLDALSQEEIVRRLRRLEALERQFQTASDDTDPDGLIHELRIHQIELETQNLELREMQELLETSNRELRETQRLLEDSRDRYAELYDFAPVGYCTLDTEGHIRSINLAGATILGAPRRLLLHRPIGAIDSIQDKVAVFRHLRMCAQKNTRVTTDLSLSAKNGRSLMVQMVSVPFRTGERDVGGFRTAFVDVTALKEYEDKLRFLADVGEKISSSLDAAKTVEALVRGLVPFLADVCFLDLIDDNGKVERREVALANEERHGRLAGLIRRYPPKLGSSAPQARVIESGKALLFEEVPDSLVERSATDDEHLGVMRAVQIRSMLVVPLRTAGRILGALTFIMSESGRRYSQRDVALAQDTARRASVAVDNARLYEQAQRALRARDDVLAIVSHDLKNPLNSILLNAELGVDVPLEADRRAKHRRRSEAIRQSVEGMSRLVDDLLDSSSLESGRFTVELGSYPADEVVQAAVGQNDALVTKKNVSLRTEVRQGLDMRCDHRRILQVLGNLIGNAAKFTPEGGAITVRAGAEDGGIVLSVADTGTGIRQEDIPHVFDRFWHAKNTSAGTGLGLTIAKGIVEAHGGRIWVKSAEGEGTTVLFSLPRAAPDSGLRRVSVSPPTAEKVEGAPSRETILVVDDDADLREAVVGGLRGQGYDIVESENGREALDYLYGSATPSLILLDLSMPVMDGWDFLVERAQHPALSKIPVIVISGQSNTRPEIQAENLRFLSKPLQQEELLEAVRDTTALSSG